MKLYFLSVSVSALLLLSSWSTGPAALNDARAIVTDTVMINGRIWMKNNLAIPSPNSFWYERDSVANKSYGRLYYFSSAMAMCPKGWHLPTELEWREMLAANDLDSMSAFSAVTKGGKLRLDMTIAGYRSANSKDDLFGFKEEWGFYWTSTVRAEQVAFAIWLDKKNNKVTTNGYRRANAFSVRYVKD